MVKIVDVAVLLDRAERVKLHLCVALSGNRDALAILEINDLKNAVADDDHVPCAESIFDPATEVQPFLNEGDAL